MNQRKYVPRSIDARLHLGPAVFALTAQPIRCYGTTRVRQRCDASLEGMSELLGRARWLCEGKDSLSTQWSQEARTMYAHLLHDACRGDLGCPDGRVLHRRA